MKTAEPKSAQAVTPPKGYPKGKPRPAVYYRLTEKDHPTIIDGLRHYASIYHIALKIGCGYTTLRRYIHKHPELMAVQKEAQESVAEFVESQIVRKCASGYFPALAFYAERKMGWTQHQTIENVGELPVINFGVIPLDELPPEKGDAEVKELEAQYLRGDREAAEERASLKSPENFASGGEDDGGGIDIPPDDSNAVEGGFGADLDELALMGEAGFMAG